MKKSIILSTIFLIICHNVLSQKNIEGVYYDDRDTLTFTKDQVDISIMSNGGLIFPLIGTGSYKIENDLLIIKTANRKNDAQSNTATHQLGTPEYLHLETLVFLIELNTNEYLDLVLIGICDNQKLKKRTLKKFKRDHKRLIYRSRKLHKKN